MGIGVSIAMITFFLVLCLSAIWWIFKTGYKLKM
ncbi:ABC transporter permease [Nitratireductor aquibiodomus RA22]|uniref:ABC transporter permease n=1 Tax=Nitratireductor aquibiodomus RA22 TaxID=1189611 RepID=I5C3E6_9HYPH|nr:ABC transporter permease [Nitratireductor aquibiodomus RA22]